MHASEHGQLAGRLEDVPRVVDEESVEEEREEDGACVPERVPVEHPPQRGEVEALE